MAAPKYIRNNSGVLTEQPAAETSGSEVIVSTLSTGLIDLSFMPVGIGPVTLSIVASEALTGGMFVNLWNNAGIINARKADASTTGKEAHGFVLASVSSLATATVYMDDMNTAVTGLTPGVQFLSDSSPGNCTTVVPSGANHIVQRVGIAVSATEVAFTLENYYVLAA